MALKVEGVVDRGMHAEEVLGGSSRFEPLHLALSSPYGLMRILEPKPYRARDGKFESISLQERVHCELGRRGLPAVARRLSAGWGS